RAAMETDIHIPGLERFLPDDPTFQCVGIDHADGSRAAAENDSTAARDVYGGHIRGFAFAAALTVFAEALELRNLREPAVVEMGAPDLHRTAAAGDEVHESSLRIESVLVIVQAHVDADIARPDGDAAASLGVLVLGAFRGKNRFGVHRSVKRSSSSRAATISS